MRKRSFIGHLPAAWLGPLIQGGDVTIKVAAANARTAGADAHGSNLAHVNEPPNLALADPKPFGDLWHGQQVFRDSPMKLAHCCPPLMVSPATRHGVPVRD